MNRLIYVGAGAFARELHQWITQENNTQWDSFAFLSNKTTDFDKYDIEAQIIADPLDYGPKSGDKFICAIANPRVKAVVSQKLESKGAEFITYIHSSAIIAANASIGRGSVICPYAVVSNNARLGAFNLLNLFVSVGHDAVIGDFCTLSPHTDITGFVELKEAVFTGSHSSILPKVKIGNHSTVGAGSAVIRNVPENTTVIGVPAKTLALPKK